VRAERPRQEALFAAALAGLATTAGGVLGGSLAGPVGAAAGLLAGGLAGYAMNERGKRRWRLRREALARPFPKDWRAFLRRRYDHYRRLPDTWRDWFHDDVRVFLSETRMTGVGIALDDELRLLVAASAVTLSLAWRDFDWEAVAEVLLYPQSFDRDYSLGGELIGLTNSWGTVILSVPSLLESFANPGDGHHVGIHEFTHLLQLDQARFDTRAVGLPAPRGEGWAALRDREMERLRGGRSVLDPYASHEPTEFLPVAVETFFERPLAMREGHAELYDLLRRYFGQDPAAWDELRGRATA